MFYFMSYIIYLFFIIINIDLFLQLEFENIVLLIIGLFFFYFFVYHQMNDSITGMDEDEEESPEDDEILCLDEEDYNLLVSLILQVRIWYCFIFLETYKRLICFYKFLSFLKKDIMLRINILCNILIRFTETRLTNFISKKLVMLSYFKKINKYKNYPLRYFYQVC